MNHYETQASEWGFRFLGMLYIEEKMKERLEKDPKFKEELGRMINLSFDTLKNLYIEAKKDGQLNEDSFLARIGKLIVEADSKKEEDIEKAKKLLEKSGYKVVK